MFQAGEFHHVGVACRHIEDEAALLAATGYHPEGPIIEDPIQRVRLQFFVGAGPRLELIEPMSPDSPVSGLLKRGTRFYHLAYEVDDFDQKLSEMDKSGFRAVGPAAPAVAFGMRRIIFMMSSSGLLVELVEGRSPQAA